MGRSVRLAAYRALSWRADKRFDPPPPPRPPGQLVWIHAAEPGQHLAVDDLAARLRQNLPDISVLVTFADPATLEKARNACPGSAAPMRQHLPSEHPEAVGNFLRHWQPDLCLWAWGDLRPNLVIETAERGCPMVLFDAAVSGFDTARSRWLPELSRQLLDGFAVCLAREPAARRRLEALGVPRHKIEESAPMRPGGTVLPCRDRDLEDLRQVLAGRPIWLAAGIQPPEIDTVLAAHMLAARLSHRLLLVLHPASPEVSDICRTEVLRYGLRMADWTAGEEPEEGTQVLVIDEPSDLGLFYRVAPVSFLGGSLAPGYGGRNPFEAAALGSAVLYGPNVRHFLPFYSRLANAGAARIVKDADTLGAAVKRLIAPDQAAAMACAGWDVVSDGAASMDRLIALVEDRLVGGKGPADARA